MQIVIIAVRILQNILQAFADGGKVHLEPEHKERFVADVAEWILVKAKIDARSRL